MKLFVEYSSIVKNQPLGAYLKLPSTKYNPRAHSSSELDLKDDIGHRLYDYQAQHAGHPFILHEAPISLHSDLHLGHFYNKVLSNTLITRLSKTLCYVTRCYEGFRSITRSDSIVSGQTSNMQRFQNRWTTRRRKSDGFAMNTCSLRSSST
jgi:hypothetical protein